MDPLTGLSIEGDDLLRHPGKGKGKGKGLSKNATVNYKDGLRKQKDFSLVTSDVTSSNFEAVAADVDSFGSGLDGANFFGFGIFDASGNLIFDSGDSFEQIIAALEDVGSFG